MLVLQQVAILCGDMKLLGHTWRTELIVERPQRDLTDEIQASIC